MAAADSRTSGFLSLLSGSAFIFTCRVAGAGLTFAAQVLLARWMGASELGTYVFAFSACLILATIGALGLPIAAIRFIGASIARLDNSSIHRFVGAGGRVVIAGSALLTLIVFGAVSVLQPDDRAYQPDALLIALAAVPFFALLRFHTGCANAMSYFATSFLPNNIVRPGAFLICIIVVGAMGDMLNAETALRWHLFVIVFVTLGTFLVLRRNLLQGGIRSGTAQDGDMRRWVSVGVPLLLVDLFASYYPELTVLVIGVVLPSEDVGVYAIAFRTAMLIMFGLNAVDAFIAPQISRLYAENRRSELIEAVNRATRLRTFGAILGAIVLLLFGEQVLLIFGTEFVPGKTAMMFFVLALVVTAAAGPVLRILATTGHQMRCLPVVVTTAIVAVVLTAFLADRYGLTGGASGAALALVLNTLLMRRLVIRWVGIRPSVWPARSSGNDP